MDTDIYLTTKHGKMRKRLSNHFLTVTPGIWMNGKTYWVRDSHEKIIPEEEISIHIKEREVHSSTKLHEVFVKNHGKQQRNIKLLFMHHHPDAKNELLTFVSPAEKAIFHIKNMIFI